MRIVSLSRPENDEVVGDAEWRLRTGVPGDLEAMYQLDVLCFEAPFRFSRAAMRRFAGEPGAFTQVIESTAGDLVGFVVCQLSELHGVKEAYVVTLDVSPAVRRRGIAGRLLAGAEREAWEKGARRMTLHVWTENAAAIHFYESHGFERLQLHPDLYGAGVSGLGYSKRLDADES